MADRVSIFTCNQPRVSDPAAVQAILDRWTLAESGTLLDTELSMALLGDVLSMSGYDMFEPMRLFTAEKVKLLGPAEIREIEERMGHPIDEIGDEDLKAYSYARFSEFADGCQDEFLTEIQPYLLEELIIQQIGHTKLRFPFSALEIRVPPMNGEIEFRWYMSPMLNYRQEELIK